MALSAMKGWAVSQAVGSERFPEPHVEQLTGTHDWPDAELVNGVAGCTINLYADAPDGAYVKAWGPERDAVAAACQRAAEHVRSGALIHVLTGEETQ